MIEATEVLHSYLRGIRRLSGARSVALFVPPGLSGGAEPSLLHEGSGPVVAELADIDAALAFAARFEPRPSPDNEASERPQLIPGTGERTVLIPLPQVEPARYWGRVADVDEERRRPDSGEEAGLELPPAAWLGLALGESGLPEAAPPLPQQFVVGAVLEEGREWLWSWLFHLGGAIAGHAAQVSTIVRDPITGLADRVGLQALLSEQVGRSRLLGKSLTLLLVNPDEFAVVNEGFGRQAGDSVVREISDRLRKSLRKSDLISRYGGVIFAVVLPDTPEASGRAVAEKLLPVLMEGAYLDGAVRLGFSIGIAVSDPGSEDPPGVQELIQRADQALFSAKREGGGCVADWDSGAARRQAGAFDRLSGIFTGNMAKDYRNMVLLSDALEVIAEHQEFEALVAEVVDRLYTTFRPERVGLFLRTEEKTSTELTLIRGFTRRSRQPGSQARLETVEVGPREIELMRIAVAAVESQSAELEPGGEPRRAYVVPLMASGQPLGCIYVDGLLDSLVLEESDLTFLEALAAQVAVAIDRAQLAEREQLRQDREKKLLRAELNELRQALQQSKMVYRSREMEALVATARRVAPTDATVLVTGESGTGKELLARTVHELSPRRKQPMVVVDCGAIATSLIESELFGHEKGAYTGAQQQRRGRLAEADGGTVLLDEIGELPLEVQSKLLRFVQEKQFVTVGGSRSRRVDVRIVAATNRDLTSEVQEGRFREDLYYRLNVVRLEIPPLRQRPDDIVHLARHFLETYSIQYQKSPRRLTSAAEAALIRYDWPGNVRELQNRLMQAVILCETGELGVEQLNLPESRTGPPVTAGIPGGVAATPSSEAPDETPSEEETSPETLLERLGSALARQIDLALAAGSHAAFPLGRWLFEDLVLEANSAAGGVARRGAALIGIPETTFRRRLQKATDQVQAGFSPRSGTWDEIRSLVVELIEVRGGEEEDLTELCERILLREILVRLPDDTGTGSKLLGVTPPTFRAHLARL